MWMPHSSIQKIQMETPVFLMICPSHQVLELTLSVTMYPFIFIFCGIINTMRCRQVFDIIQVFVNSKVIACKLDRKV